jgi:hypothetical protein
LEDQKKRQGGHDFKEDERDSTVIFEYGGDERKPCSSSIIRRNHGAFAEDALNANHMNVNPAGQQSKMRDTTFKHDNGLKGWYFQTAHRRE